MCSANCAGNVGYGAAQQINGLLLFHKAHISTLSNNEASTVSVPTKISLARLTINVSRLTVTPIAAKRSDRVSGSAVTTDGSLKITFLRINWCQLVTSWQLLNE
jgi:hypothetical protein